MMRHRFCLLAVSAALLVSCAGSDSDSLDTGPNVVKQADGHPLFLVRAEVPGHRAHGVHNVFCMEDQMLLRHLRIVELLCPFQRQHKTIPSKMNSVCSMPGF